MSLSPLEFNRLIYSFYEKEGRTLPWREDLNPWGILVSEFMLQQTKVQRVEEYWKRWMKKWPNPADLHNAGLEEVLREWSGLGYNRRCKFLKDCAGIIVRDYKGKVPGLPEDMIKLPGIGPYTAGAIPCFAYNHASVFIETNIRSVMIRFFFPGQEGITDKKILPVIDSFLDRSNPRKWYWALMDYGAALKKTIPNPNRQSAHYTRQKPFTGSFRQLRGAIMRSLINEGPGKNEDIQKRLGLEPKTADFYDALEALKKDSLVAEEGGVYRAGN
ncbi:MAG: A/G-specific adenine glycosylase [Treponema sp.]|jgi:A/G-specific adenine glycosylase|nr:A/G-specific adenine glycosylase [Treponema sp.]